MRDRAAGIGIGLFQGGSNLFVNGLVLSVMYCGGVLIKRPGRHIDRLVLTRRSDAGGVTAGGLMSMLIAAQAIERAMATLSSLMGQARRSVRRAR